MQAQVEIATGTILAVGLFPAGSPAPATIAVVTLTPTQELALVQPGTKVLNANGSITVTPPPPPPLVYAGDLVMSGRLRTTTATPAEVYRATLAPLTGYRALATLLGVDAGNGDLRQIYASIVAKRLNGGALLIGAPAVLANHQDAGASTWAITATASGNDLVITVTGAAGRTIDWLLDGHITTFTPGGA